MRAMFGNDGYAFYFLLLERIYKSGGVLDVQNPAIMAAIRRSITADSALFDKMMDTAIDLGLFDGEKYRTQNVLTSPGVERRMEYVSSERERKRAYHAGSDEREVLDVQNPAETSEKPLKHKTINNISYIPPNRGKSEETFDTFWNAYPRKVAKKDAKKSFEKLKPDNLLIGVMLAALEKQKRSLDWKRDGGQYIPYPASWLNGKRWEDEADGMKQQDDGWEVLE